MIPIITIKQENKTDDRTQAPLAQYQAPAENLCESETYRETRAAAKTGEAAQDKGTEAGQGAKAKTAAAQAPEPGRAYRT